LVLLINPLGTIVASEQHCMGNPSLVANINFDLFKANVAAKPNIYVLLTSNIGHKVQHGYDHM
jgi:hypothetical protein